MNFHIPLFHHSHRTRHLIQLYSFKHRRIIKTLARLTRNRTPEYSANSFIPIRNILAPLGAALSFNPEKFWAKIDQSCIQNLVESGDFDRDVGAPSYETGEMVQRSGVLKSRMLGGQAEFDSRNGQIFKLLLHVFH